MDFYDNSDGLSQGTVNCIHQDRFGYMWFGTQDGLNKFDGINFKIYKHDPLDSISISDNYIYDIEEDERGNLWIGTRGGGLSYYDIQLDKFTSFKQDKNDPYSLSHDLVNDIEIDANGDLWIGTYGGLNKFSIKSGRFESYNYDESNANSLSNDEINCLFIDSKGSIWIGTTKGLNKFNPESKSFTRYFNEEGNNYSISSNLIRSIWEDRQGNIWIGTIGGGLNKFNQEKDQFESYQNHKNNPSSISNNDVLVIKPAPNNKIWIGTDGGYLNLFDPSNGEFTTYQTTFPRIQSVFSDVNNNTWIGIRGGLNMMSDYYNMFTQYSHDNSGNLLFPNEDVHAICMDDEGFIWAGSSVNGLSRIDPITLKTERFINNNSPNSISSNNIRYLFKDSENTLWIGTSTGLNKYNKETNDFSYVNLNGQESNSVNAKGVNFIYEDSQMNLWICTNEGLINYNRKEKTHTTLKKATKNSLFDNNISCITEDQDGIYWIGFNTTGFDRYDPEKNEFQHFEQLDAKNSLSNNRVSEIYNDKEGYLWIATYGGGLDRMDKATFSFTNFSENSGLQNTSLYCVMEDNNNHLWMSHNEGISSFDKKSLTFKNYFDGVEFNGRAYFQTEAKEILLGSVYSVVKFDPKDIIDNSIKPTVHINELKIFNELVTPNTGEILKKVVEITDSIVLDYDQNFMSFGFVALNYLYPDNNHYKYKLENFDVDWIEAQTHPFANYTNVPPGEYTFKVVGSNNDLIWNNEGDSLFIKIKTPWWNSIFFKIILFLVVVNMLILIYKMRMRNLKNQKIELESIVAERTEELRAHEAAITIQKENISDQNLKLIALNEEKNNLINIVSHDLKSPLNQIKGLASIIKMINPDLNNETNESLNLINDLVDRQNKMISKILDTDAIDTNNVNLELVKFDIAEILSEVSTTLKVVAATKAITIKLNYNENLQCIEADKNYFIQAIENIISNAIKFSPQDTTITISANTVKEKTIISIQDEGPGINKEDMRLLFTAYSKLSAQPTANESSTGLGLSIAKKYIDYMNGSIWCESEIGKGATFFISFDTVEC